MIKNIIIDLGGVIIDLKRERAVAALKHLGIANADALLGLYRQEGPFLGLETGRLTAAEFFDELRRESTVEATGITDRHLQDAFNEFLVDLPIERLQALRKLREAGYRTYMLSNTNPVMYLSWIAEHFRQEGLTVNDYFDGCVVSFQELTCKPDPEIFRRVLTRYHLNPAETIMLDDSEANCQAAETTGMQSRRIQSDFTQVAQSLICISQ